MAGIVILSPAQTVGSAPELVERILSYTCADGRGHSEATQALLADACLVARCWTVPAKRLLYSNLHVELHPNEPVNSPIAQHIIAQPSTGQLIRKLSCDLAVYSVGADGQENEATVKEMAEITDYVVQFLALCPNVRDLWMRHPFPLEAYSVAKPPVFQPLLQRLALGQSNNDLLPKILAWLPNLKELSLEEHFAVGNDVLKDLPCQTPLETLYFRHSSASPHWWLHDTIAWFPSGLVNSLTSLTLGNVGGSSVNIFLTKDLPSLRILHLRRVYNHIDDRFAFREYPSGLCTLAMQLDDDREMSEPWDSTDFESLVSYIEASDVNYVVANVTIKDQKQALVELTSYRDALWDLCERYQGLLFELYYRNSVVDCEDDMAEQLVRLVNP